MRHFGSGVLAAMALVASLAIGPRAGAATTGGKLDLECKVQETRGNAHREMRRRLVLDLAARTVKVSDDTGQGWRFRREYVFLSANADRIVLEASEGKDASIDRRTGEYVLHNRRENLTIRGVCRSLGDEKPKF